MKHKPYLYGVGDQLVWYKHGFKCKVVVRFHNEDFNRYVIEFINLPAVFTLHMETKETVNINYRCQSLVAGEKFLQEEFRTI
jgi:hypothetical protein